MGENFHFAPAFTPRCWQTDWQRNWQRDSHWALQWNMPGLWQLFINMCTRTQSQFRWANVHVLSVPGTIPLPIPLPIPQPIPIQCSRGVQAATFSFTLGCNNSNWYPTYWHVQHGADDAAVDSSKPPPELKWERGDGCEGTSEWRHARFATKSLRENVPTKSRSRK